VKFSDFRRAFFEAGKAAMSSEPACRMCDRPMRPLKGRTGVFWACQGFPWCRNTRTMPSKQQRRLKKNYEWWDDSCH